MNLINNEEHKFYVIPAYQEEIQYKLKFGMSKLDDVFREKKLQMILNLKREYPCADFKEQLMEG